MKKLLLSSLVATSIFTFAYTTTDVSNASFLANQGIIVKQSIESNYRLDNTITRAEAIGIALKIKWVTLPDSYSCKKYFSDTTTNDWKCRAIELAADNGIITRNNTKARPNDTITRAEALAIVMKAGGVEIQNMPSINNYDPSLGDFVIDFMYTYSEYAWWQANVFYTYWIKWEFDRLNKTYKRCNLWPCHINLKFNDSATRSEVFGFTKNILEYKAKIVSGEVTN